MKTLAASLVFLVACGEPVPVAEDNPIPQLMALAAVQVITVDHTFGQGPSPFTEFLVLDHTDPSAGDPTEGGGGSRPLTEAERETIETAIAEYGPVTWLTSGEDWQPVSSQDNYPALVGVGEPVADGDHWLVPVSMICGNLCGTWLTYRIEKTDDEWAVTGIEGPVAIS